MRPKLFVYSRSLYRVLRGNPYQGKVRNVRMKTLIIWSLALSIVCLQSARAWPQTLNRGPYLQTATPTSMIVKWRTDTNSSSRVRYGAAPNTLNQIVDVPGSTQNHRVALSGLDPETRYYYAVGTSTKVLAGGDSDHFFVTSPIVGHFKATRIWVIGDSGTADNKARAVRDGFLSVNGGPHVDLWLMLGDNAYNDGQDDEYQEAVFNLYPSILRNTVVWPTFGNHDARSASSSSQSGAYYDIFSLPKNGEAGGIASGTEAYYAFDYANIHFVVLDSQETNRSAQGTMATWLENDLANTTQEWIVAYWHHPPYSKGSHDSDNEEELIDMRQNFLPILEDGGVDLVLSGHSHSYERSLFVDGHYGASSSLKAAMILDASFGRDQDQGPYTKNLSGTNTGTVYSVAGSSGKTSGGTLDHPVMKVNLKRLGSMLIDINARRLDAAFIDDTGTTLDRFSILKVDNVPPRSPEELQAR